MLRRDLRKLLARLRVGLVRPGALQEAVEEACARLVTARYKRPPALQEASTYARPFLDRFEREIAQAQISSLENRFPRAIRSLEEAERALDRARRMARAHDWWDDCRQAWARLGDQPGFETIRELLTLRMAERGLVLTESLLKSGETRKALFVARQCRDSLDRVSLRDADDQRRRHNVRRLVRLQSDPEGIPPELSAVLGRLIDDGRLEFAERLVADWEIDSTRFEAEDGRVLHRRRGEALARLGGTEGEARTLAATLAAIGGPGAEATDVEIEGGKRRWPT